MMHFPLHVQTIKQELAIEEERKVADKTPQQILDEQNKAGKEYRKQKRSLIANELNRILADDPDHKRVSKVEEFYDDFDDGLIMAKLIQAMNNHPV